MGSTTYASNDYFAELPVTHVWLTEGFWLGKYGLHDGNVTEWASDYHAGYPGGTVTDPRGEDPGTEGWGIVRGGNRVGRTWNIRAPARAAVPIRTGGNAIGFRLARTR